MAYGAQPGILKLGFALTIAATPLAAETKVVAMLGDSLTQGYGLAADDGLVPSLQRWLSSNGEDVRMINAGVSGDTTAGGAARIDWTLTSDVDALIVALGANDLLRGLPPGSAKENIRKILQAARHSGVDTLLVGFPAPGNFGPDYKQAFDAVYRDLAQEFGVVFLPDMLAPLRQTDRPLADYLQADRLHPNVAGVALIVDGMAPKVQELLNRLN